jgi:hypothetical protein
MPVSPRFCVTTFFTYDSYHSREGTTAGKAGVEAAQPSQWSAHMRRDVQPGAPLGPNRMGTETHRQSKALARSSDCRQDVRHRRAQGWLSAVTGARAALRASRCGRGCSLELIGRNRRALRTTDTLTSCGWRALAGAWVRSGSTTPARAAAFVNAYRTLRGARAHVPVHCLHGRRLSMQQVRARSAWEWAGRRSITHLRDSLHRRQRLSVPGAQLHRYEARGVRGAHVTVCTDAVLCQ